MGLDLLADIHEDASGAVRAAVDAAYEAGRTEGRREALAELQAHMAGFFGIAPANGSVAAALEPIELKAEGYVRAAPGSVKPTIERMLADAENGLTPVQISERTGFKYNSVRGTLWTLGKEGLAKSRKGRWYALKNEAAVTPSGDEPTASKSAEDAFGHIQQVQHPA